MNRPKLSARERRRLERELRETPDARLYRRILAILECDRGRSAAAIAEALGTSRQTVYNWIDVFSERSDPGALRDAARPGRPRLLAEKHRALLRSLLEISPARLGYFGVNWTVPLLQEQMERAAGIRVCNETIRRELQREGYVWKRPRYVLQADPDREKKAPDPPIRARIGP